ncbi:uncharacterized protein LOC142587574 isoform X2 [Dermacentor variabilis]|uniref:uncharacterized protein LOC142587574 isoform X2 n=1 Tax=Dermacentor variabilis TaxID=34621 RepID=UPI003F5C375F
MQERLCPVHVGRVKDPLLVTYPLFLSRTGAHFRTSFEEKNVTDARSKTVLHYSVPQNQMVVLFVGTKDPIWTWNTTTKDHISCEVDEMKSMTQGSIYFTRKFHTDRKSHPITKNYEGIFPKHQQNVMELRKPGYHFVAKQTILFLSETYRCAVIKVTPTLRGHLPYYDLRLWNSAVRQGPHEKCIARFMKLAPSGHVIYDLQCHDNLHHEGYLV